MKTGLRNVVIIGASQGIGEALVREYARIGATVVMLSRNVEGMKRIADAVKQDGGKAYYHRCDATDRDSVHDGIAYAKKTVNRIDLAIYNAGTGSPEWIKDFSGQKFDDVMKVNASGMAYLLEALVPVLRKQGGGVIAGVSSLSDVRGYPGSVSYSASKAALTNLLESARIELKPLGIRVITIRPGWVRTALTDRNEFAMPFIIGTDRAARIIRKGIARGRRRIEFPFPVVLVSRLARVMPVRLFDWLIPKLRKIPS